jgi:hypothetical protein
VKLEPNAYVERERPFEKVKKTSSLELLRAVFEGLEMRGERVEGGMRLLLEGVARVEGRGVESPKSPVDDSDDDEPSGFVTEDLETLGLGGSEGEDSEAVEEGEVVEIGQTPSLRRSGRLMEKRKASKENGGNVKRRRDVR